MSVADSTDVDLVTLDLLRRRIRNVFANPTPNDIKAISGVLIELALAERKSR